MRDTRWYGILPRSGSDLRTIFGLSQNGYGGKLVFMLVESMQLRFAHMIIRPNLLWGSQKLTSLRVNAGTSHNGDNTVGVGYTPKRWEAYKMKAKTPRYMHMRWKRKKSKVWHAPSRTVWSSQPFAHRKRRRQTATVASPREASQKNRDGRQSDRLQVRQLASSSQLTGQCFPGEAESMFSQAKANQVRAHANRRTLRQVKR